MDCAAMGREDPIEAEVNDAVVKICEKASTIINRARSFDIMPHSDGSSVIFLRPVEGKSQHFIPTPHLRALFEEQRITLANEQSLKLFFVLSLHASTRTAAGWAHERLMHERLLLGGEALSIFQGTLTKPIQSATRFLPGTLASLKLPGPKDPFYWIPSVVNFPGIDSVLGDADGHVYTIQATIANQHKGPKQGIQKVWDQFRPDVRRSRTWHFVVVTNSTAAAEEYVERFRKELRVFKLGQATVQVWACVL
jgi:hypothetical protein